MGAERRARGRGWDGGLVGAEPGRRPCRDWGGGQSCRRLTPQGPQSSQGGRPEVRPATQALQEAVLPAPPARPPALDSLGPGN